MQKRHRFLLVSTILALLFALVFPAQALAQVDGFQETFDDPDLPGWERHPDAVIKDGVLLVPPNRYALHIGDWSDITLTVKLRFSGEGEAIIAYYFRDGSAYTITISPGTLSLYRDQEGARSLLESSDVAELTSNDWLNIKVIFVDNQHQVFINDSLILSVADLEPMAPGAILLSANGELSAEFDDLDVRGMPSQMQPAAQENPPPQVEAPVSGTAMQTGTQPATPSGSQPGASGIIEEFFASQASALELNTLLINLLLAAAFGYILSLVYIHWGSSLTNRRRFAANFILLTITTTFIIMVVRSSVALSLGLVGALSIVRFRTAVKEPEELAYLFVAIGIGIGLGDNQRLITLLALAAVLVIIFLQRTFHRGESDVNLHLTLTSHNPDKLELDQVMAALRPHVEKIRLLRFDETAESLEAAFLVEFGRLNHLNEARAALKGLSDSLEITFMDNKGLW